MSSIRVHARPRQFREANARAGMRAEDRAADDDEEPRDDLAPARGILFVLMLALLFWGILAWLVWLL